MTEGERYWNKRGIALGAKVEWDDSEQLPGTPPHQGKAALSRDGSACIMPTRKYSRIGWRWGNVDDWQPVYVQTAMFS